MAEYLIAFNDEWVPEHSHDELMAKAASSYALVDEMRAAGVFVYGGGGIGAQSVVCSVEAVDGEPVFTDGPFAETTEHLGGFVVLELPDDDAARDWAGRLAVVLDWPQEVHRFPEHVQPTQ